MQDQAHDHSSDTSNLKVAFFLNFTFTLIEIVGGLLTNSVAILSDALHDLGDSFSLGLAWGLQRYSEKGSDRRYSYGYRRYSLLAALVNAIVLIGGSLVILSEAIPRLADPESFDAQGMILIAIVGIVVNGLAAMRLRGNSSANTQVISLHLLEDVLGWVAVLVVGIISLFADVPILDPILSILITLYVLVNVLGRLRQAARLFLQAVPEDVDLDQIRQRLEAIDGVQSLHHTHLWSLDGEHNVFTTHIVVSEDMSRGEVLRIKEQSREAVSDLNLEHLTMEIEFEDETARMEEGEAQRYHAE